MRLKIQTTMKCPLPRDSESSIGQTKKNPPEVSSSLVVLKQGDKRLLKIVTLDHQCDMENSAQVREAAALFGESKAFIAALRNSSLSLRLYSCIILLVMLLTSTLLLYDYHGNGHFVSPIANRLPFPYFYAMATGLYVFFSVYRLFQLYRIDDYRYPIDQLHTEPRLLIAEIIAAYEHAIQRISANHRRHYHHVCRDLIALLVALLALTVMLISNLMQS